MGANGAGLSYPIISSAHKAIGKYFLEESTLLWKNAPMFNISNVIRMSKAVGFTIICNYNFIFVCFIYKTFFCYQDYHSSGIPFINPMYALDLLLPAWKSYSSLSQIKTRSISTKERLLSEEVKRRAVAVGRGR